MNQEKAIDELIRHVSDHNFQFIYRGRQRGNRSENGWNALNLYSPNAQEPDPLGHFKWLGDILEEAAKANTPEAKLNIANAILKWGGMRTKLQGREGEAILNAVISSALEGTRINGAPMNSSYTKIASVFGYGNNRNTIWDSRVSTAICFRLACIFKKLGVRQNQAKGLFPDLGYIPGQSKRVKARLPLIQEFWPNVYQQWKGHFSGSKITLEIAKNLNSQSVPVPQISGDPDPKKWTPWKVNMVFFIDDIHQCISPEYSYSSVERKSPSRKGKSRNASVVSDPAGMQYGEPFRAHRIINRTCGIHFEPDCIKSELNNASAFNLSPGEHGLEDYRLLIEFYRMQNGNCKIGARVRVQDPSFDSLLELAHACECPPKRGGINLAKSTQCIFVYRLGQVRKGRETELEAIREFLLKPPPWYSSFLKELPRSLYI